MEDMFAKLQEILSSKEGQEQLKNVAAMFGSPQDGGDVSGGYGTTGGSDNADNKQSGTSNSGFDFGNLDMGMLMKLQGLLSNAGKDDDNTRLLVALKPHLSEKKQGRVDTAVKIMGLLTMLPVIKESGLLGGLFDGGK